MSVFFMTRSRGVISPMISLVHKRRSGGSSVKFVIARCMYVYMFELVNCNVQLFKYRLTCILAVNTFGHVKYTWLPSKDIDSC